MLIEERLVGELSVWLDHKTVRDKEGRGKLPPTVDDWVNSVNAGFKVAEHLTEVNPQILIYSIESVTLEGSTVYKHTQFSLLLIYLCRVSYWYFLSCFTQELMILFQLHNVNYLTDAQGILQYLPSYNCMKLRSI